MISFCHMIDDVYFDHSRWLSARLLYCQIILGILYFGGTFKILVLCILWRGTMKLNIPFLFKFLISLYVHGLVVSYFIKFNKFTNCIVYGVITHYYYYLF